MDINSGHEESTEADDIDYLKEVLDCIYELYEERYDNEPVVFSSIGQKFTIRELIELLNDTIEVVTRLSRRRDIFLLCIHGVPEEKGLRESFWKWLENQVKAIREHGASPQYICLPPESLIDRLTDACLYVRDLLAGALKSLRGR